MAYLTLAELRTLTGIPDTADDMALTLALAAAENAITVYCSRDFTAAGTSATARVFTADGTGLVWVDDIGSLTDLVVKIDEGDDGTYETTITSANYQMEPLNARFQGLAWSYDRIRRLDACWPVSSYGRALVQITARWGWPAVPDAVKQATALVSAELFKRKDAPFGIAGFGDFGPIRLSSDALRGVSALLEPYRRPGIG